MQIPETNIYPLFAYIDMQVEVPRVVSQGVEAGLYDCGIDADFLTEKTNPWLFGFLREVNYNTVSRRQANK